MNRNSLIPNSTLVDDKAMNYFAPLKEDIGSIVFNWIRNPVDPHDQSNISFTSKVYQGRTLREYLDNIAGQGMFYIVFVNNEEMKEIDNYFPKSGDIITFCHNVEDNDIFRVIGLLAVIVIAAYTQQWYIAQGYIGGAFGAAVAAGAVGMVGSYIVNAAFPIKQKNPEFGSDTSSPNYGWGAPYNLSEEGIVIPSLIGERTFAPVRVEAYRYLGLDNTPYLRMLYLLCGDPIDKITTDDVFVNTNPISNYPDAEFVYSQGTNSGKLLKWFNVASIVETQQDIELPDRVEIFRDNTIRYLSSSYSSTITTSEEITSLTFQIYLINNYYDVQRSVYDYDTFSYYYVDEQVFDDTFSFRIRYRLVGETTWTVKTFSPVQEGFINNLTPGTHNPFALPVYEINVVSGVYEYQYSYVSENITGVVDSHIRNITGYDNLGGLPVITTTGDDIEYISINYLMRQGLYYLNDNGGFSSQTIEVIAFLRIYGETEIHTSLSLSITGKSSAELRRNLEFKNLPANKWEIITFVTGNVPTGTRYQNTVYVDFIQEGINKAFKHPKCSMLAISIPATENLHDSWPLIEVKAKRADYSSTRNSRNPAWQTYHRLIGNYRIPTDLVNLTSFTTWAQYCIDNELTAALYLDAQSDMTTIIDQLGRAGRAIVMPRNGIWEAIILDKQEPKQLFSSDNIIFDSFKEEFISGSDKANSVLFWFFNKEEANRKTPIFLVDSNADLTFLKTYDETNYAIDNIKQATEYARMLLNRTNLIKRRMKITVGVDCMTSQWGDVAYLQNNLPAWGITPGRIVSATSTDIVCDLPLDFSDSIWDGRQLVIILRHQSPRSGESIEFIERLYIDNPYPATGVISYHVTSGNFERVPEGDCLISIGWVTREGDSSAEEDELLSVKQVRIIGIESNLQEKTFELSLEDYYDEVFEYDYIVQELIPPESGLTITRPSASSYWVVRGNIQSDIIRLNWSGSSNKYYVFYRVDYSNGASNPEYGEWVFYRSTSLNSIDIEDLQTGFTYQFSISQTPTPDENVTTTIAFEIADHVDIIEAVSNLRCAATGDNTWVGRDLDLVWDANGVFTLDYYRVEILNAAGTIVLRQYEANKKTPRFNYTFEMNAQDHSGIASASVRVRVIVVDQGENEASTSIVTFTNSAPGVVSNIRTLAGSTTQFIGKIIDIEWDEPSDDDIELYEVIVNHGDSNDVRVEYVTDNRYTYTYEKNSEDGLSNYVIFSVKVIDAFGNYSSSASAAFTNPAPATPGSLSYSQWMNGIRFYWQNSTDRDFLYFRYRYQIESEGWSNWEVINALYLNIFLDADQSDTYENGADVDFQIVAVDSFGSESSAATSSATTGAVWVPPTALQDVSQLANVFMEIPVLQGDVWTDNDPLPGGISWSEHILYYNGEKYTIAYGNNGFTGNQYIYFDLTDPDQYKSSSTDPTDENKIVVAQSIGGVAVPVFVTEANMIIGSAYIRQAAIVDLHVKEISAAKILANTILTPGVTIGDYITVSGIVSNTDTLPDNSLILGNNIIGFHGTGQRTINLQIAEIIGVNTNTVTPYAWNSNAIATISVDCSGVRKSNSYLEVDIRCTDWTKVESAFIDIFSLFSSPYEVWKYDITSENITSSYQTFQFPLTLFGNETYGELNVSNIIRFRLYCYFSEQETIYFRNARIVHDKYPVLISTEDDLGKCYIGNNASSYWDFDGVRLNISPDSINVRGGANINLIGSDTDPGKFNFIGSQGSIIIGANDDGLEFVIEPENINCVLNIGNGFYGGYRFSDIHINSTVGIDLYAYNSGDATSSRILMEALGDAECAITFSLNPPNTTQNNLTLKLSATSSTQLLSVNTNKVLDLFSSSACADDAYADNWNNVADLYFLDSIVDKEGNTIEIDDVKILENIKPSTVLDKRTGMTVINDTTLPNWLVVRHKADGEEKISEDYEIKEDEKWHWISPGDRIRTYKAGDIAVGPEGKPYISNKTFQSLLMGAIRKLSARIEMLEKK